MMSAELKHDTQAKVVAVVAHVLQKEKEVIGASSAWEDLKADSLDKIEIIMRLEEAFNIQIDDDTFHGCIHIQAAVDYVHGLRG